MPKYRIFVSRDVTQTVGVIVDASDLRSAAKAALDFLDGQDSEELPWVLDHGCYEPYIALDEVDSESQ